MLGISSSFIIFFFLFFFFCQLTAVLIASFRNLCALLDVASFFFFMFFHSLLAPATCMFLVNYALHCFNMLLLLHYGPHGSSFSPYDFGPLFGSGSQSATPIGGKNFQIFYLFHKTCPFTHLPLGSTLFFLHG